MGSCSYSRFAAALSNLLLLTLMLHSDAATYTNSMLTYIQTKLAMVRCLSMTHMTALLIDLNRPIEQG